MSNNIDAMTADQLRDALAVAAGWENPTGFMWHDTRPSSTRLSVELGSPRTAHPIPPLDSPDALGVVAGMMPTGYAWIVSSAREERGEWTWSAAAHRWSSNNGSGESFDLCYGPTETIARARLFLKVLAATRKEGEAVMDCLVDGCDCQDAPPTASPNPSTHTPQTPPGADRPSRE